MTSQPSNSACVDKTPTLKALMQQANIPSFRALATQAKVSEWQVRQLRAGKAQTMRLAALTQLAEALALTLSAFLQAFGEVAGDLQPVGSEPVGEAGETTRQLTALRQEYQRLQVQTAQQAEAARSQLKSEALQTLETWLVQWPTIAKRAQDKGDELAAVKVLPFVKPVEKLMGEWGVAVIAPVDAQVAYDPQLHQLVGGSAAPGATVQVTHSGRQHQGKLLHRAKVKLV
ncbi:MAG: helix-turn-helix transcriptional regulator [Cyanobacteria bacterium J06598_3]